MHRDTAAKRIMRESLGGTSADKPVSLTSSINTSLSSLSAPQMKLDELLNF